MFELQQTSGTWGTGATAGRPYESRRLPRKATVAAIAVADAPGWLKNLQDPAAVARRRWHLKHYLRTAQPPHDYGRVLLLWASAAHARPADDRNSSGRSSR